MVIEVPEKFEAALKLKAKINGLSTDAYVEEMFERDLAAFVEPSATRLPRNRARGSLSKYGPAPTAEEIDANRADMFRNFGEEF